MKRFFLLSVIILGSLSLSAQAPKFGYVNSQELLSAMPEFTQANSDLEVYQKQLMSKGEEMVKSFEAEYAQYVEQAKSGLLSQVTMQNTEKALGEKQKEIQDYEVEMQQSLAKKRESLYQPILDKVKVVIEDYGKENGYTMIFDTSTGTLLHAADSDNLLEPLKEKLAAK